jgi:hypothetical protein
VAVTKRSETSQSFEPQWPDLTALPEGDVRFTYDRPTDTLFIDFYGEARAAASIPLNHGDRDYLYLRVDPESDAVVGLQIEHVLSYAIARHPELTDALDAASLVGVDRETLRRLTGVGSESPRNDDAVALIDDILRLSA